MVRVVHEVRDQEQELRGRLAGGTPVLPLDGGHLGVATGDGLVDAFDIDPFVRCLVGG